MKKKVILAYPYTEELGNGKTRKHKADASVSLDRAEANRLLHAGLARIPDDVDDAAAPVEDLAADDPNDDATGDVDPSQTPEG